MPDQNIPAIQEDAERVESALYAQEQPPMEPGRYMAAAKETVEARHAADGKLPARQVALNGASRIQEAETQQPTRSNASQVLPIIDQLRVSRRAHRILNGMLVAIEEKDGEVCGVLLEDQVKIYIPCKDFFITPAIVIDGEGKSEEDILRERVTRETTLLSTYLGSTVSYIVTDVKSLSTRADHGNFRYGVTASRKLALEAQRDRVFAATARNPVSRGTKLNGRIIAVSRNTLRVCVGGVDATLYKSTLTNRFIEDLHDVYSNGDEISVSVTKIERDEKGRLLDVEFSARDVETEQQRPRLNLIPVGTRCIAKIIRVFGAAEGRGVNYILDIPAYQVSANAQSTYVQGDNLARRPQVGDSVLFLVREVTEQGVSGVIIRKM